MNKKNRIQGKMAPHRWRFFRSGGFDQVQIDSAADMLSLDQLDKKLWAALSCPTRGLELDSKTLDLLDTDGDERIRVPEIISAVKWAGSILKKPEDLTKAAAELPLDAIDDSTTEGEEVRASARQILSNLGKADATAVSADDTADPAKIFAHTKFNGDGIISVETAADDNAKALIQDIIDCFGPETDRSGEQGISLDKVTQFFEDAQAYVDWWKLSETDATILPFGENTAVASTAYAAVKGKVDDYFTRCQLAAFDVRAAHHLNCAEEKYDVLATEELSVATEALTTLPLANIEANQPLPLDSGINPSWGAAIATFRTLVVTPTFGNVDSLTTEQWAVLNTQFASHQTWLADKGGGAVEKLGIERIREVLVGSGKETLVSLIEQDKALEKEANAIASVDRLVHYYRDLYTLLNNFVSLRDFYTGKAKAVFQAGTLYLDGRSCELCVKVDDVAEHSKLAALSLTYLAYCECRRRGSDEKMTIAAAFTDGDADNLMVGRNGVFYDRNGADWDATIVKIIEHPISIRQAFWLPYKRFARMIGGQIEKMASSRDKAMQDRAAAGVSGAAKSADAGKAVSPPPFDVAKFAGIFAAIGLAVGAIGTMLATVATGFFSLHWWQMPLAVLGIMLLLSGPAMILAWLKLRKRTLAPILDANGWAVNTQAKINIPFGTTLTGVAKLPKNAQRSLADPFAAKRTPWKRYVFLLALTISAGVLWQKGYIADWYDKGYFPEWAQPVMERIISAETNSGAVVEADPAAEEDAANEETDVAPEAATQQ